MPSSEIETVGGKLYTFGSYRLGAHTRGKILVKFRMVEVINCN